MERAPQEAKWEKVLNWERERPSEQQDFSRDSSPYYGAHILTSEINTETKNISALKGFLRDSASLDSMHNSPV